jgi:membrane protein DedA with SNARE-associated domain
MDIAGLLDQLTETISSLITDSPTTYLVVLGLTALDVLLPIIPAEATVLLAAVYAGTGQLNVVTVAVAAAVGAFIGDNIAYWIGRAAGRPLVERVLRGQMERLAWVETQLRERGGALVITGRFIPGGRTVVAVGSGVLHMPWLTFAAFDAIAAVIWSLQAVLPGYIGGAVFADKPWLGFLIGGAIALSIVVGIEAIRWFRRRRKGEPAPPAEVNDRVSTMLTRAAERREHAQGQVADPAVDDK